METITNAETIYNKEKGIPIWIIYVILGVIAAIVIFNIIVNANKPIEEKAYEAAVEKVEQDSVKANYYFDEYDERFVEWIDMENVNVTVQAYYYQGSVKKTIIYDVVVNVEGGNCFANLPMRRVDEHNVD